jgi:hypothetical protein
MSPRKLLVPNRVQAFQDIPNRKQIIGMPFSHSLWLPDNTSSNALMAHGRGEIVTRLPGRYDTGSNHIGAYREIGEFKVRLSSEGMISG